MLFARIAGFLRTSRKVLAFSALIGLLVGTGVWLASEPQPRLALPEHFRFAFSPDGKTVAGVSGWHQTVQMWDCAEELGEAITLGSAAETHFPVFSRDGTLFAVCDMGGPTRARVWNVKTKALLATYELPDLTCGGILFAPDNRLLAIKRGEDIDVIDVGTGTTTGLPFRPWWGILWSHDAFVDPGKVVIQLDGKWLAFDLATGETMGTVSAVPDVRSSALSANGRTIATVTAKGVNRVIGMGFNSLQATAIEVWNTSTGEAAPLKLDLTNMAGVWYPLYASLNPDGSILAVGPFHPETVIGPLKLPGSDRIDFFEVNTGRKVASLHGASEARFLRDGRLLVTEQQVSGSERAVRLLYDWPLRTPWLRIVAWSLGATVLSAYLILRGRWWLRRRRQGRLEAAAARGSAGQPCHPA